MPARSLKNKVAVDQAVGQQTLSMPVRLPWRSLTWQLILVTILPLTVLVLAVAFGSLAVHQKAMRSLVGERDERAVQTAAAALNEQINHRTLAIRSLSLLGDGASTDKLTSILASSDYLLPEFDGGLAFFKSNGELEVATPDNTLWQNLDPKIASLIQNKLTKDGSPLVISISGAPGASDSTVLILTATPDAERIAAGAFSANEMVSHTLTDAFAGGPGASVVVLDGQKQLLYEGGAFSSVGDLGNHPGVAEALSGKSGTQYIMVGNQEHVVAYSPITNLDWALVYEEPWDTVESPTLRTSQLAPLVLAPVLILAIVALWFGARQIIKPLQTLESRAAMLAWGDFKAIEEPVGGIDEIRQLQNELVHMARKVQSAQESLHGYIGAITVAQEDERRRLARELHDDTIQALIALKQRVQLSQMAAPRTGPEAVALREIAALTEQTIENLRRLTRALRPIYLEDLGLVTALEMLARETGQTGNIIVKFERQGTERRLEPSIELALYRIAQEALSNVTRHSQASRAILGIAFTVQSVTMQVADNGIGFDIPKNPAEFAPNGHYGLLGLHERAELIGASLEINSASGEGTQVNISLPI